MSIITILKTAYIFHSLVFQNSSKKVKKNEEEKLLLLTERCYENDFYIYRWLNNTRVQKYIGLIKNFAFLCDLRENLATFNFF